MGSKTDFEEILQVKDFPELRNWKTLYTCFFTIIIEIKKQIALRACCLRFIWKLTPPSLQLSVFCKNGKKEINKR